MSLIAAQGWGSPKPQQTRSSPQNCRFLFRTSLSTGPHSLHSYFQIKWTHLSSKPTDVTIGRAGTTGSVQGWQGRRDSPQSFDLTVYKKINNLVHYQIATLAEECREKISKFSLAAHRIGSSGSNICICTVIKGSLLNHGLKLSAIKIIFNSWWWQTKRYHFFIASWMTWFNVNRSSV